jgi:hypothetical protein
LFKKLVDRVRRGNEHAAAELVRLYESATQSEAWVRLVDNRRGSVLDSMDICQAVMKDVFVREAVGQYELETHAQLMRILAMRTRNKLANEANSQRAGRRDYRRAAAEVVSAETNPSRYAAARELLDLARATARARPARRGPRLGRGLRRDQP